MVRCAQSQPGRRWWPAMVSSGEHELAALARQVQRFATRRMVELGSVAYESGVAEEAPGSARTGLDTGNL